MCARERSAAELALLEQMRSARSQSGYRNVYDSGLHNKRFQAKATVGGARKTLGYFASAEEAALAVAEAEGLTATAGTRIR